MLLKIFNFTSFKNITRYSDGMKSREPAMNQFLTHIGQNNLSFIGHSKLKKFMLKIASIVCSLLIMLLKILNFARLKNISQYSDGMKSINWMESAMMQCSNWSTKFGAF